MVSVDGPLGTWQIALDGPFAFRHQVYEAGYYLTVRAGPGERRTQTDPDSWLMPECYPDYRKKTYSIREYVPIKTFDLHRRFGNLVSASTDQEIIEFANSYGLLGCSTTVHIPNGAESSTEAWEAESLDTWHHEILEMQLLRFISKAIRDHRKDKKQGSILNSLVTWQSQPKRLHVHWEGTLWKQRVSIEHYLPGQCDPTDLLDRWQSNDVFGPAEHFIWTRISSYLKDHVMPVLDPLTSKSLYLVPRTLLGALYVLFALELMEPKGYPRLCSVCGGLLPPGHRNRTTCSDSCRSYASYHRNKGKHATDNQHLSMQIDRQQS